MVTPLVISPITADILSFGRVRSVALADATDVEKCFEDERRERLAD